MKTKTLIREFYGLESALKYLAKIQKEEHIQSISIKVDTYTQVRIVVLDTIYVK